MSLQKCHQQQLHYKLTVSYIEATVSTGSNHVFLVSAKTLSGRPIYTIAVSRHYELLYNMGVQLLHCGKPTAAFDCLIQSLEQCQINPRLWLRLAECCIMVYREV